MSLKQSELWRRLRERKIVAQHRRVAAICQQLIEEERAHPLGLKLTPKQELGTDRIIWQYWGQGYEDVPPVVCKCLDSVDRFAGDFRVIRLCDANLDEYLDMPAFVRAKRSLFSRAFFSDLLRLMLLDAYGGIWLDATVYLSGAIPEPYFQCEFFLFRRDPAEPDYKYWRNTYAYYFGWASGFRVNMLSSIMMAKRGSKTVSDLCKLMLHWWKEHDDLPDYFFLQVLYDVYGSPADMPLVSDTLPHYLQQSVNDPEFKLMPRDEILKTIPLHKLTYK